MQPTYSNHRGCTFTALPLEPITCFTESSEIDSFSIGDRLTDDSGTAYTLLELRYISGRLWRATLLPIGV